MAQRIWCRLPEAGGADAVQPKAARGARLGAAPGPKCHYRSTESCSQPWLLPLLLRRLARGLARGRGRQRAPSRRPLQLLHVYHDLEARDKRLSGTATEVDVRRMLRRPGTGGLAAGSRGCMTAGTCLIKQQQKQQQRQL